MKKLFLFTVLSAASFAADSSTNHGAITMSVSDTQNLSNSYFVGGGGTNGSVVVKKLSTAQLEFSKTWLAVAGHSPEDVVQYFVGAVASNGAAYGSAYETYAKGYSNPSNPPGSGSAVVNTVTGLTADTWYAIWIRCTNAGDSHVDVWYYKAVNDPPPGEDGTGSSSAERYNRFMVTCPWVYPESGDTTAISKVQFVVQYVTGEGAVDEAKTQRYGGLWSPTWGGQWQAILTVRGEPLSHPNIIISIEVIRSVPTAPSGHDGYDFKMVSHLTLYDGYDFGVSQLKYTKSDYLNHPPEILKGLPDGAAEALPTELLRSQNNATIGGTLTPNQIGDVPAPASPGAAATSGDIQRGSQAIVDALKTVDSSIKELGAGGTNSLNVNDSARKSAEDAAQAVSDADKEPAATDAKNEGKGIVNGLDSSISESGGSIGSGDTNVFHITVYPGYVLNLDPAADAGMSSVAQWIRVTLQWALCAGFGWWAWGEMQQMIQSLMLGPQARGNTVAGTGGQVTALIAASLITVLIFTTIPILWTAANTATIATSAFFTAKPSAPAAGTPQSGALYLLGFYLPWSFIMTLIAHMFAFRKFALGTCVGVHAAIKYFVP